VELTVQDRTLVVRSVQDNKRVAAIVIEVFLNINGLELAATNDQLFDDFTPNRRS
jgi:prophage maintenance system killer protein